MQKRRGGEWWTWRVVGGHDNNVVLGDLIGRNNCNHYTTLIDSQGNTGRGETDQSQPASHSKAEHHWQQSIESLWVEVQQSIYKPKRGDRTTIHASKSILNGAIIQSHVQRLLCCSSTTHYHCSCCCPPLHWHWLISEAISTKPDTIPWPIDSGQEVAREFKLKAGNIFPPRTLFNCDDDESVGGRAKK